MVKDKEGETESEIGGLKLKEGQAPKSKIVQSHFTT